MPNNNSILPPEIDGGVIFAAGQKGVGKSYFLSGIENPALVAFLDFEKKGSSIHRRLNFGFYQNMTDNADNPFQHFMNTLQKLEQDKYTTIILDNISILEMYLGAEVVKNSQSYAKDFGMIANAIKDNKYGAKGGAVNYLITHEIAPLIFSKGIKIIGVSSQVKNRWGGGVQIPNKYNIKGAERWQELSILTLVLGPGDFAPTPSALVFKEQLGKIHFNGTEVVIVRCLPFRIPRAIMTEVKRYLKEPANLESPAAGEKPSKDEIDQFSERLNKTQLGYMAAALQIQDREEKAFLLVEQEVFNEAKTLVNELAQSLNGLPTPILAAQILPKVQEQYPNYTQSDVIEMLGD